MKKKKSFTIEQTYIHDVPNARTDVSEEPMIQSETQREKDKKEERDLIKHGT